MMSPPPSRPSAYERFVRLGVLAWAGITLAPALGAVLMSASTIVVALNAQLLRRLDLRPS